jgi:hypothetical protein
MKNVVCWIQNFSLVKQFIFWDSKIFGNNWNEQHDFQFSVHLPPPNIVLCYNYMIVICNNNKDNTVYKMEGTGEDLGLAGRGDSKIYRERELRYTIN